MFGTGSVTGCDNLHCGLWKILRLCVPLETECRDLYFCYSQSLPWGILMEIGSNFDFDKNFKLSSIFENLNF